MAGLTLAPTFAVAGIKDNRIQETRGKTLLWAHFDGGWVNCLRSIPGIRTMTSGQSRHGGVHRLRAPRPGRTPRGSHRGPPPHEAGPRCSAPRPRRWLRISNTSWFFEGCTCATGTTPCDAGRALAQRHPGHTCAAGCRCLQARCERPCPGRTHRRRAGRIHPRHVRRRAGQPFRWTDATRARTSKRFPTPRGVDRRTQEAPPCGGGPTFRPYGSCSSRPTLPEPSIECRRRQESPHEYLLRLDLRPPAGRQCLGGGARLLE